MVYVRRAVALLAAGAVVFGGLAGMADARKGPPRPWTNCKTVNAKYPHGVGRVGAHDRDMDGKPVPEPVTDFKRSTKLYELAMKWNKRLDRDKDGIACEKH